MKDTDYVNDVFMIEQSTILTTVLMEASVPINKIISSVKNYQRKYICIHKQHPLQSQLFTAEMWNKLNQLN